ncbi:MAG: Adenylate/guanylate cyclase [uncultured bacterium]|uniref:Chemotaxis protein CheY n=1 Tax=Candidatus Wolfebacteria bacterium GW2011_GWE2_44_13 TaxID=1619017 RepID=A0A0G1H957_9BACT|nr:MAG: Adenylate/guanylate cyclase [uncultured bacterium]KKT43911.1 MAG: chemotaxis protein CheY [Candidatus Wolfebacteria bacterium GW2011_GWE2_44_13]
MNETQKRILVVDDDPALREIFGERLTMAGYFVLYAKNGNEGYAMAKAEKPDFILLDVIMPEADGPEALDMLKSDSDCKDIPVVFLTSIDDRPEDIKAAKEVGAVDYWSKAADFAEFIPKIAEIINKTK